MPTALECKYIAHVVAAGSGIVLAIRWLVTWVKRDDDGRAHKVTEEIELE